MRWLMVFVALPGIGLAQWSNVDDLVAGLMTSRAITGFEIKAISRTGDAAGAALTRYVAGMVLDAAKIDRLLWIVHGSFGSPAWVEHVADRDPKATLPLLDYLDTQTRDAAVRKKIADERAFVLEQVAKLKVGTTCLIANRPTVEAVQMVKVYRLLIEPERINAAAWPRMGDRAAGVLTKLIGTCRLDEDDTRRVLNVVRWSFAAGGSTAEQTLTLLQNLEATGGAADIAATRQFVMAQVAKVQ
jgi:hypothetical protein